MTGKEPYDKIKYNNAFNKEKYDRISLMVPSGKRNIIKTEAKKLGMSTNEYINRAIELALTNSMVSELMKKN